MNTSRRAVAPLALAALLLGIGCAEPPVRIEPGPAQDAPSAPWQGEPLPASAVPPDYVTEWRKAENRAGCALLAPASTGVDQARPRAATFSGGWGVAYDLPDLRSAFGVAGTGALAAEATYSEWPHSRAWSDGSSAGYGPEGGTGPNQLAYLRVTGQDCLYNVWSRLGVEHLEHLLESLRFVADEVGASGRHPGHHAEHGA